MSDDESEFPSPSIVDSRRLFGANLYSAGPGAVLEVTCDSDRVDALCAAWSANVARIAESLGWRDAEQHVRRQPQGASLFVAAPVDALMTATDVNELSWVAAESGVSVIDGGTMDRLRTAAVAEVHAHPNFAAVVAAANQRGISTNFDDDSICVGSGTGSRVWPFAELPSADAVPWSALHDVPIALVTGSNGKTTTTRLVAAMCRAAGRVAGWSCSDGVWVDEEQLESGDYSGPAGARAVLRDRRVEAAVLETARGGMLRRGLAVTRASAAIITNISADHFGEYGISALDELAEVKLVVARALVGGGRLILNADDPHLVRHVRHSEQRSDEEPRLLVSWFSPSSENAHHQSSTRPTDIAILLDGRVSLRIDGVAHDIGTMRDMPLTLGGAAVHNIANLLGAMLVASSMRVPIDAIRETAMTFGAKATDNPGRLQVYRFGSVTLLMDYAHNPDGLASLCATAQSLPATRRLLILGQAGNRDDELLRKLARAAFETSTFDRVIIKEMATMLRGRAPGEIPRILSMELTRLGLRADQIEFAQSEMEAVRSALRWANDGDLLVCPVHVSKPDVMKLMNALRTTGWRAGHDLPSND